MLTYFVVMIGCGMKTVYICENCNGTSPLMSWIFSCYNCGKEICDTCMHGYGVCEECAKGKTEKELEDKFEEKIFG